MSSHSSAYAAYKEKQQTLARLLEEASEAITVLDMESDRRDLKTLAEKTSSDSFKIQVVGTFKNGKSTFINSFLGSEVLPAYARPCTAVINEIMYGKEPKALLFFRNPPPPPDKLSTTLSEKAVKHMNMFAGGEIPPIEIPENEIEDYVVIPMGKDPKEMLLESPYEKVLLSWPLELLENGVEIIDSPGLNEHVTRTRVTHGYLNKADAILFILTADKLCAQDEMEFINNLKRRGFNNVYFIVNRFDTLRNDRDRKDVIVLAKRKLAEFTAFGEDGLHFVSALNALEGKTQNNADLYNGSGMPEFERALSDFLVNEKGRAKLSQPAHELKRILETEVTKKAIPQRRGMLESELDELIARRDAALPRLERLRERQAATRKNITKQIDQAEPELRDKTIFFFSQLSNHLGEWIEEFQPTIEFEFTIFDFDEEENERNGNLVAKEIIDFACKEIETEVANFEDNTIGPLISDKIDNIINANEANFESVRHELDVIQLNIAGLVDAFGSDDGELDENTLRHRLFLASGFFAGSNQTEVDGKVEGLVESVAFGIGGLVGFIIAAPFALIDLFFGSKLTSLNNTGPTLEQQAINIIKERVLEKLREELNNRMNNSVEPMIDSIKEQLWGVFEPFLNKMAANIQEAENQVNQVIEDMKQGQQEVDRQKALLASCEEKVASLNAEIDEFISNYITRR